MSKTVAYCVVSALLATAVVMLFTSGTPEKQRNYDKPQYLGEVTTTCTYTKRKLANDQVAWFRLQVGHFDNQPASYEEIRQLKEPNATQRTACLSEDAFKRQLDALQ